VTDHRDDDGREVIDALRAALDAEARANAATPSLAAARRKALAARRGHGSARPWAWGFGGLATVAAGVLGLVLWLGGPHGPAPVPPTEDLELLASGEGVEFYADLDFYLWLEEDGGAG